MSNEDYVSLEVAKKLREKGFDEPCNSWYGVNGSEFSGVYRENHNNTFPKDCRFSRPTLYDAQKWLRENHLIHITILCDWDKVESYSYYLSVCDNDNNVDIKPYSRYSDYNECVNAALIKALNRI